MAKNGFVALVVLVMLSLGLVSAVSVYAQDRTTSVQTNETTKSQTPTTGANEGVSGTMQVVENERQTSEIAQAQAEKNVGTAKDSLQTTVDRLQGDHLLTCEVHQKAIGTIMSRAAARGTQQISLFSTITSRVETFYVNKGKTLSNYSQLVADVATAKTAAQSAVQAVQSADVQLDCNGSNPPGQVGVFRTLLKAMETSLEQYRTSVKSLIVGVKSVQSTTTATTNGAK